MLSIFCQRFYIFAKMAKFCQIWTRSIERVRSATRFGGFLQLWKHWQFYKGFYSIWQHRGHTLACLLCHWVNFYCFEWLNIKRIIQPSGHTVSERRVCENEEWLSIEYNERVKQRTPAIDFLNYNVWYHDIFQTFTHRDRSINIEREL